MNTALYSQLDELIAWRFHVKQKTLHSHQKLLASSQGDQHAVRKGRGMTFSEVRQYQAGDDIRHIDWRVTARTQKTHTKLFIEEHERPTMFVLEQSPALFFGSQVRLKTAQALNLAAILGWISLQQQEKVGGICFNGQQQLWFAPQKSQNNLLHFLQESIALQQQLQQPGTAQPQAWLAAIQRLQKNVKPGSRIFLIGDLLSFEAPLFAALKPLLSHTEILAIHLFDSLEKHLPELGWLSLEGQQGQTLRLDSFRRQTREHYQHHYQQRWEQLQHNFYQLRIPVIEIANHEAPVQALAHAHWIH
ncbi:MAG: DUF58 domain-containing protein [Thiotrichales bacterium]|nr:DUF58 domain-containing protein [Thiotrichales bacterium]